MRAARSALAASDGAGVVNIASMYASVSPDSRIYATPGAAKPVPLRPGQGRFDSN
ncbi:MAG: hypothetical protein WDM89_19735 [Rhizomicrobium sp.]